MPEPASHGGNEGAGRAARHAGLDARPVWVRAARIALVVVLMPAALGLAAWPMLVAGGYRPYWMDSAAMEPAIPQGKLLLLIFHKEIEPEVGRACAVRVGSREGGLPLLKVRRIVALEGDTVSLEDGHLRRNGELAAEGYAEITPGGVDPLPPSGGATPDRISLHDGSKVSVDVDEAGVTIPKGYVMTLPDDRSTIQSTMEPWLIEKQKIYAEVLGH